MARVPVTEVFFRNSVPPTLRRGYEVFLYKRGTSEKAPIFTAESGGEERGQPLITDVEGRVRTDRGGTPWVAEGKYTFKNTDLEELIPINLPEGVGSGGGGGAVESVNGQTGVVVLTAANVGADASGAAAAAQAASQPLNSSLTSISSNGTSSLGLELLKAASAAAARTALGLGTAATEAASSFLSSAAGAVGTANLAANAVTAAKLGSEAVETAAIKALNVTEGKIAANAITNSKIATGAVQEGSLGAEAVTTAKLKLLSVTAAILASESVEEGKIKALAVSEGKLATAVQTKLKGAEKDSHTFSMPAGTEAKAENIGQFWKGVATGQTVKLVEMKYTLASGTSAKFSIKQNGTAVTGFKELTANSTEVKSATGEISVANADLFLLVVETATGTPKGLSVTLIFEGTH